MNCTIEELHSAGMKSTFPYGKLAKSSSLAFYTRGHLRVYHIQFAPEDILSVLHKI